LISIAFSNGVHVGSAALAQVLDLRNAAPPIPVGNPPSVIKVEPPSAALQTGTTSPDHTADITPTSTSPASATARASVGAVSDYQFFSDGPIAVIAPWVPKRSSQTLWGHSSIKYAFKVPEANCSAEICIFDMSRMDAPEYKDKSFNLDYFEVLNADAQLPPLKNGILKDCTLQFAGNIAREFEITPPKNSTERNCSNRGIVMAVGERMYTLSIAGTRQWIESPDILRLMGSFAVTLKDPTVAPESNVPDCDFHWQAPTRTIDLAAFSKERDRRTYCTSVQHLEYVPDYSVKVKQLPVAGRPARNEVMFAFRTKEPLDRIRGFYDRGLQANGWKLQSDAWIMSPRTPPGQITYGLNLQPELLTTGAQFDLGVGLVFSPCAKDVTDVSVWYKRLR